MCLWYHANLESHGAGASAGTSTKGAAQLPQYTR